MKNKFLKGFTFLTVGAVLAKIIGAVYKIALTRILGAEAFGLYQQIFPVYTFFVVLITAGVPLGVSKLIAKKESQEEKLKFLKLTLVVFLILSLIVSVILFVCANLIATMQGNASISICYNILSVAIIFSAITAVLKGYFQSYNNFKPTAVAQILEQVAKVVFGLSLSLLFASNGLIYQISAAIVGVVIGDAISLLSCIYYFKKNKQKLPKLFVNKLDVKELFKTIFPIILASLIIPFSQLIDSILVVKLLNKNFSNPMSSYLYGLQSGVVNTLVSFPSVITFALVSILLPTLTKDYINKDEVNFTNKISFAIKLILILVVPCSLFVLFFSEQIISLLYSNSLNGFNVNGVALTSKMLFWSAFNIIFLCFSQFLSVCLQAREHRYLPVVNNIIGMLVKLFLEIVFVPSVSINVLAFTLANSVGYFTIFFLNFFYIKNEIKIKIQHSFYVKLAFINITVILLALLLNLIGVEGYAFTIIAIVSVVIYLFLLFVVKIFNKDEIKKYLKANKNQ